MNARIRRVMSSWLAVLAFGVWGSVSAVAITHEATDLADTTPGEDLRQYGFTVSLVRPGSGSHGSQPFEVFDQTFTI